MGLGPAVVQTIPLLQKSPQPLDLGLSLLGTMVRGLGTLLLGLGKSRHQTAVWKEEPCPGGLLAFHDTLPEPEIQSEDLAPQPSLLVGPDGLIEVAGQPEAF